MDPHLVIPILSRVVWRMDLYSSRRAAGDRKSFISPIHRSLNNVMEQDGSAFQFVACHLVPKLENCCSHPVEPLSCSGDDAKDNAVFYSPEEAVKQLGAKAVFSMHGDTNVIKINMRDEVNMFEVLSGVLALLTPANGEATSSKICSHHDGESVHFQCKLEVDLSIDAFDRSDYSKRLHPSEASGGPTMTMVPCFIEFSKPKNSKISKRELLAMQYAVKCAFDSERCRGYYETGNPPRRMPSSDYNSTASDKNSTHAWKQKLESLGVQVYLPGEANSGLENISWNDLGGCNMVKERISESIMLSLKHGDLLAKIAQQTRSTTETNSLAHLRPKVVLFEGPPGTGKTSSAKIIAKEAGIPMLYVPLERLWSKWFGESEKTLAEIFEAARHISPQSGCLIFVDEIDSLAASRDSGSSSGSSHEVTKRLVSILLQKIDGFDTAKDRTLLICASNRKEDIDDAFISRIDVAIRFPMPDCTARGQIVQKYAKQLQQDAVEVIAEKANGLSGRDIKNLCCDAERRWLAILVKKDEHEEEVLPPPLSIYLDALEDRILSLK